MTQATHMDDEDYIRVRGRIKKIRDGAVLFAVGETVERGGWVPRSLIHGADDLSLNGRFAGEEMTLRIFAWKAREMGFEAVRADGGAAGDLFEGD